MPEYIFSFYFPDMDEKRQNASVPSWGGNLGTAFSRAWRHLKVSKEYKGIKNLVPISVGITRRSKVKNSNL